MKKKQTIEYKEYSSLVELTESDQQLMQVAKDAASKAYAPYSEFKVGSAVKMKNGNIVIGSNQENAAYPSGLCAERVALFSASANYPDEEIESIFIYAISDLGNNSPVSPCGACRQVISEYQQKQSTPLRIVLQSGNGLIWEFESIRELLPFAFDFKPYKK